METVRPDPDPPSVGAPAGTPPRGVSARGLALAVAAGLAVGVTAAGCRIPFARPRPQIVEYTVEGDEFRFDPSRLTISRGREVRIIFRNRGRTAHDFHIENLRARITDKNQPPAEESPADRPGSVHVHAEAGQAATITFIPQETGRFRVICTVPGHEQLGMVGEVIIR